MKFAEALQHIEYEAEFRKEEKIRNRWESKYLFKYL